MTVSDGQHWTAGVVDISNTGGAEKSPGAHLHVTAPVSTKGLFAVGHGAREVT